MPSQKDVKEIGREGKVKPAARFDSRDWDYIAEYVIEEFEARKGRRRQREKYWAEVDRQCRMEPDIKHKSLPNGAPDSTKAWMAEMELPLQAQALEVMTADSRRFQFSDQENWFRAHAETTEEYFNRVSEEPIILGENDVPSDINQENADKLVEGFVNHIYRQYDFESRWDKINAEAFKYGTGVGRMRMYTKNLYIHEAKGVRKETQKLPILVPCSIKNLYLDDAKPSMHSATEIGPAHIACDYVRLENLYLAASKGSKDPNDEDGGWMPKNMRGIQANDDKYVEVIEYEGDLVVPRKTVSSLYIPGVIVTVVKGAKGSDDRVTRGVIRFRFRQRPYSSYLIAPYHYEDSCEVYSTSPLEKGRPVQMMAVDALNRWLDSAALKNRPPVGFDRTDMEMVGKGGPMIFPGAQWATNDPQAINVFGEVGGDPSNMTAAMQMAVNLYAELTGVLPARLGAQTVSHTTAYSKEAELQRGAVRTIDYVKSLGKGVFPRMLSMTYEMGRDAMKRGKMSFYIDDYDGYVEVSKDQLPEKVSFEWLGSAGAGEEQAQMQRQFQGMQLAIQLDNLRAQQEAQGIQSTIDFKIAIKSVLRKHGWADVDAVVNEVQQAQPGGQADPGIQAVALQQLGLAGANG